MSDAVAIKRNFLMRLALVSALALLAQSCSGDPATEPGKGSIAAPAKPQANENIVAATADAEKSPPDDGDSRPEESDAIEQTLAGSAALERTGEDWAEFLGPRGTGI